MITAVLDERIALPHRRLTPPACRRGGPQRVRRSGSRTGKCASRRERSCTGPRRNDSVVFPQVTSGKRVRAMAVRVGVLCWGELTINGSLHLRARDYTPGTGTFTRVDPLPGRTGSTTTSNPYHYADNDPLNRVDPTGMTSTQDCNLVNADGKCPVVINDIDNGFKASTRDYDVPERGQLTQYDAAWYQAPIASTANQYGVDARMVWGIFKQETSAGRSPYDDHLALASKDFKANANLGPTNLQLGQVAEVAAKYPWVMGRDDTGGLAPIDALRLWVGLIGNGFDTMDSQVLLTTLWLKILDGKLDDAISARNVKQIGVSDIASTKAQGNVRLYRRSALIGAGHVANYDKWWGAGKNLYIDVFTSGDSLPNSAFVRSISQDDGWSTYTGARDTYCSAGAFVC